MLKQKNYDILGSNIAGLGTDLEKNVREAAAACEEQWKTAGQEEGLQIWRIEKFQVVPWPKDEYGHFYDGDSYIVLKTAKVSDQFVWDVHFWLGLSTSQDEAGTAAYKTVELDDYLGTFPTQHREVQGNESDLFLSYFPNNAITILSGGVDSGFNHVTPEEYRTRLLHIKGTMKCVRIFECELSASSLNSGDIFLLDKGTELYQMNGAKSSGGERMKAGALARAIDDERKGAVTIKVAEQGDGDGDFWPVFWEALGGEGDISDESGCDKAAAAEASEVKKLFCLKEADGELSFNQVSFAKETLDSTDVFIMDQGHEVFVWVGKGASEKERKGGLQHAQDYLSKYDRPLALPITRVMEGGENEVFNAAFA
eukprot:CAMPEP_0201506314 /NCGR_PEP_ID=MMETSP0161_2-20130828/235_1 /ASSEMBLY_ACC=CAM_ASM_000251 /TAXON_ID=180227 /ORGANISM="Neoparamoeba aestuarina, Strain SoJaBio B1-5/56/2" /LENGTH=368 /DNA_ID=CAMNT_0047900371 /DNA_START=102 /DNA_END=1208 /DNA_ORIENTATION=-